MTAEGFRGDGKVSPLHRLGQEAGDGGSRLVWVQLREQVAHVVGCASLFPRNETKQPGGREEDVSKLKPKQHGLVQAPFKHIQPE